MSQTSLYDETSIIMLVAEGNEDAFRILFNTYRDQIFSIAHTITKNETAAEDVVQEVFIKLWLQKEKLPALDNFMAYVNTITRNHIFSQLRKLAIEDSYLQEIVAAYKPEIKNASDIIVYNELKRMLDSAVNNLPPQQQKVYKLGKIEGKRYDEIAEILNISKDTVKEHMTKASNSIRVFLLRNEGLV